MDNTGYTLYEPTAEEIAEAEAAMERMAEFARKPQKELNEMFDSTAFNDICRGYMILALESVDADEKLIRKALEGLNDAFDMVSAEKAFEKYETTLF